MTSILFVTLLLGILAGAEAIYYLVRYLGERQAAELRRRLRNVGSGEVPLHVLRQSRLGRAGWAAELLSSFSFTERLEALLDQVDSKSSVPGFLVRMGALAALGLAAAIAIHRPLLGVVLAPMLGAVPLLLLLHARSARTAKLSQQLPDAIDMMARAVKAGHALPSTFKVVAQECGAPIGLEFAKVYEQQNLGVSLDAAVLALTQRVPESLDLKLLAVSLHVQSETGGNLVEVLESMADMMRERFKFFSKLRSLTAEARVSGVILGALPFIVALLIAITNPNYLSELTVGMGRAILAGGLMLWLLGIVWIKQLMKVAY